MVVQTVYTYSGGEKAGAAAKGKDVEHRSIACERAGQLHGLYANRPGPVITRPGLMVFQNYRARTGR